MVQYSGPGAERGLFGGAWGGVKLESTKLAGTLESTKLAGTPAVSFGNHGTL